MPIVIAHRGASGYLPEHTLAAKALAYGFGADYLEQDVVATRDGVLVVLHDLWLDAVSDVAERFPGRARADGLNYAIDFDFAELAELRLHQRRALPGQPAMPGNRFRSRLTRFQPVGFAAEIEMIAELNRLTGRRVGVYPEIKHPGFHTRNGIDLAARLLESLADAGLATRDADVYVQCFDAGTLMALRSAGAGVRLVQLTEAGAAGETDWHAVAGYADAAGCAWTDLIDVASRSGAPRPTGIGQAVRAAGLELHAYTLRRDEPEAAEGDFDARLRCLIDAVGVDGLFTDHPDAVLRLRDQLR